MSPLEKRALEFSKKCHEGQTDRQGEPYINHVIAVADRVNSPLEKTVAYLHDVVEDCGVSVQTIRIRFGAEVAEAVNAISRRKNEDYDEYLARVKANRLALVVKKADIDHNSGRLSGIEDKHTKERLTAKYIKAKDILESEDEEVALPRLLRKKLIGEAPTSPLLNTKTIRALDASLKSGNRLSRHQSSNSIDDVYDELQPRFEQIKGEFEKTIKSALPKAIKSGQGTKFLTQVKSLASFKNKVIDRGKPIYNVGDIVRGALLLPTQADVDEVVRELKRKLGNKVVGYEVKEKGSDPNYGYYGSHHFDIMIDGLVTELQVMTNKLWNYKDAAHQIYNDNRVKVAKGEKVPIGDRNTSKRLFSIGNTGRRMKEDLDEEYEWVYIEVPLGE